MGLLPDTLADLRSITVWSKQKKSQEPVVNCFQATDKVGGSLLGGLLETHFRNFPKLFNDNKGFHPHLDEGAV